MRGLSLVNGTQALLALALVLGQAPDLQAGPITVEQIRAIVQKHVSRKRDYVPGDLITRADVEPIFNELLALDFKFAAGQEELYDSFIPDNAPLTRLLRTPPGRKFMRQISHLPGAYDHLERLSWFHNGRDLVDELVDQADGPALFQAMLEPGGMDSVLTALGAQSRAESFALPTGHIHTMAALQKHLEQTVRNAEPPKSAKPTKATKKGTTSAATSGTKPTKARK